MSGRNNISDGIMHQILRPRRPHLKMRLISMCHLTIFLFWEFFWRAWPYRRPWTWQQWWRGQQGKGRTLLSRPAASPAYNHFENTAYFP